MNISNFLNFVNFLNFSTFIHFPNFSCLLIFRTAEFVNFPSFSNCNNFSNIPNFVNFSNKLLFKNYESFLPVFFFVAPTCRIIRCVGCTEVLCTVPTVGRRSKAKSLHWSEQAVKLVEGVLNDSFCSLSLRVENV